MNRGYIKLWRKSIDSGMLSNPELWRFWCYCLTKAAHKPTKVTVGFQEIHLEPGQFLFGRKQAAKELKTTERKIRTGLASVKKSKKVTIKTTNKFSIISIVNWHTYQGEYEQNGQQNDQQATSKRPQTNTTKHIKNNNNNRAREDHPEIESIEESGCGCGDFFEQAFSKAFSPHEVQEYIRLKVEHQKQHSGFTVSESAFRNTLKKRAREGTLDMSDFESLKGWQEWFMPGGDCSLDHQAQSQQRPDESDESGGAAGASENPKQNDRDIPTKRQEARQDPFELKEQAFESLPEDKQQALIDGLLRKSPKLRGLQVGRDFLVNAVLANWSGLVGGNEGGRNDSSEGHKRNSDLSSGRDPQGDPGKSPGAFDVRESQVARKRKARVLERRHPAGALLPRSGERAVDSPAWIHPASAEDPPR